MNGLTLLAVLALAVGVFVAWRAGIMHGRRDAAANPPSQLKPAVVVETQRVAGAAPAASAPTPLELAMPIALDAAARERARLVRSMETEVAALRRAATAAAAEREQLREFAEDRRRLLSELAQARAEAARYRDIVIDLENNALPPLLDGPGAPDDLKLIVGVGPVLERMLHQLGVTTYRQIARWTERDIDDFDAKLPEFPGRIRRDGWVTQARELHLAKFGESLPARER